MLSREEIRKQIKEAAYAVSTAKTKQELDDTSTTLHALVAMLGEIVVAENSVALDILRLYDE